MREELCEAWILACSKGGEDEISFFFSKAMPYLAAISGKGLTCPEDREDALSQTVERLIALIRKSSATASYTDWAIIPEVAARINCQLRKRNVREGKRFVHVSNDAMDEHHFFSDCLSVAVGHDLVTKLKLILEIYGNPSVHDTEGNGVASLNKAFHVQDTTFISPTEILAIRLYFLDGKNQTEVSQLLGISQSQISRTLERALLKLRTEITESHSVAPFLHTITKDSLPSK